MSSDRAWVPSKPGNRINVKNQSRDIASHRVQVTALMEHVFERMASEHDSPASMWTCLCVSSSATSAKRGKETTPRWRRRRRDSPSSNSVPSTHGHRLIQRNRALHPQGLRVGVLHESKTEKEVCKRQCHRSCVCGSARWSQHVHFHHCVSIAVVMCSPVAMCDMTRTMARSSKRTNERSTIPSDRKHMSFTMILHPLFSVIQFVPLCTGTEAASFSSSGWPWSV